jgi:AcrR family transcriptional regulator
MPSRKPPKLINRPTQQRSRDTHDAIMLAFQKALATTPYDQITVADIAAEASTSVGGFYARFSSKEAMLLPLIEDMTADFRTKLVSALDDADRKNGGLSDVITIYVRTMLTEFRKHGRVLQQVFRSASGDVAAAIGERVHEFNQIVHEEFRTRVWARRKEIHHRSPRAAIEIALFMGSATAREAVNTGNWRSYAVQPDDATITREISAAMLAYLSGLGSR